MACEARSAPFWGRLWGCPWYGEKAAQLQSWAAFFRGLFRAPAALLVLDTRAVSARLTQQNLCHFVAFAGFK